MRERAGGRADVVLCERLPGGIQQRETAFRWRARRQSLSGRACMTKSLFSDDAVRLDLLRERAFNLRWAQLPADVIPLTAADPDFPVCPAIQEQLVRYVRDGVLSYGPPEGLPQFRHAVASWRGDTRNLT